MFGRSKKDQEPQELEDLNEPEHLNINVANNMVFELSVIEIERNKWSWMMTISEFTEDEQTGIIIPVENSSFSLKTHHVYPRFTHAVAESQLFTESMGYPLKPLFQFNIFELNNNGKIIFNNNDQIRYNKVIGNFNEGEVEILDTEE